MNSVSSLPYGNRPPAVSKSPENGPFMPLQRQGGKAAARPVSIGMMHNALARGRVEGRFQARFPGLKGPDTLPEGDFLRCCYPLNSAKKRKKG